MPFIREKSVEEICSRREYHHLESYRNANAIVTEQNMTKAVLAYIDAIRTYGIASEEASMVYREAGPEARRKLYTVGNLLLQIQCGADSNDT